MKNNRDAIGFIGLGAMGKPMAENLLAAGFPLVVYNRSKEVLTGLAQRGAVIGKSPGEVAQRVETTIFMLSDKAATDEVVTQWLQGAGAGKVLVNMATLTPAYNAALATALAQHGVQLVEAPVMGSIQPAQEGNLVVLAAGDAELVEKQAPIFEVLGRKTVSCGDAIGDASKLKLLINLMLGIYTNGLVEVANLGRKMGLPSGLVFGAIQAGPLNCALVGMKKAAIEDEDYRPHFSLGNMFKDLGYALEVASEFQAHLPLGLTVWEVYQQGNELDLGSEDLIAIDRVYRTSNSLASV